MDFVRQVIDFFSTVFWAIADILAQALLTFSGSASQMTESEAQNVAAGILFLILLAWIGRQTILRTKFAAFQPMSITLQTTKTPWQVLMGDLRGCFSTIVAIIIFLIVIAAIVSG